MNTTTNTTRSPDGFKISDELTLTEFLNRPNTDGPSEYVHIFADAENRELRIYRSVAEAGGPKIMTRIPGVVNYSNLPDGLMKPDGFYLTGGKGETVLTLLRCFRNETTAEHVRIEWWFKNNSPSVDNSDRDNESLIVSYRTGSGREERVHIDNSYGPRSHMMATGMDYDFPN